MTPVERRTPLLSPPNKGHLYDKATINQLFFRATGPQIYRYRTPGEGEGST